jgi:hypothetical protein
VLGCIWPLCSHAAGNLSLLRNKSFVLLSVVYAVQMAIVITWQTLIDEFLDHVPGFTINGVVSSQCAPALAGDTWLLSPQTWPLCVRERLGRPSTSLGWSAVFASLCTLCCTVISLLTLARLKSARAASDPLNCKCVRCALHYEH